MSFNNIKHIDPNSLTEKQVKRFWRHINKTETCWIWNTVKDKNEYGHFRINGVKMRAHRFSWSFHHKKPFPEGMLACHTCDTPACVNPLHIYPGSMSNNISEAIAKGRHKVPKGTMHLILKAKTHCLRGHEYTPENTKKQGSGRSCLECNKSHQRKYRLKRQALHAAKQHTPSEDEELHNAFVKHLKAKEAKQDEGNG